MSIYPSLDLWAVMIVIAFVLFLLGVWGFVYMSSMREKEREKNKESCGRKFESGHVLYKLIVVCHYPL